MKYRTICPVCKARISRMGALSKKAKCKACGAMLRQNVKWDWIVSGVIGFFIVLPIVLATLHQLPWIAALAMEAIIVLVAFLLFPYISKYEIDPKHNKSSEA